MLYTLNVRVGKEYYPVQYDTGRLCWEDDLLPTTFTVEGRELAQAELSEGEFKQGDYMWKPYIREANHSITPIRMMSKDPLSEETSYGQAEEES